MLIFKIAINRLGASDDSALCIFLLEILSQKAGIGVRVITADDDKTIEVELLSIGKRVCELLRCLNLVTAGA